MTPRWERSPVAPPLEGRLFMDAVLRPHRSLSLSAFRLLLIVVIAVNLVIAAIFWASGAYPVAGFLGLDVLALWLAFAINYRAARMEERVRVVADRLWVTSVAPSGAETHWALNPIWARVVRDGTGVLISAGGGRLRVGAFMSPTECDSFAAALDAALHRAKRG